MLKLYKNLKAQDWAIVVLIVGITVAQVWFTMELTDQIADSLLEQRENLSQTKRNEPVGYRTHSKTI